MTCSNVHSVWLVEHCDYEQSGITLVAASEDTARHALVTLYGPPYVVEWEESRDDDGGLMMWGRFEQVLGYSTKHRSMWRIYEMEVVECESHPDALP